MYNDLIFNQQIFGIKLLYSLLTRSFSAANSFREKKTKKFLTKQIISNIKKIENFVRV